jgi:hypothetical protein
MAKENEARIHEAYERHMNEFMRQINGAIRDINLPAAENMLDMGKTDPAPGSGSKEVPAPLEAEHAGPDRINEIRNEAAAVQLPETRQSIAIRNPDKQRELMEIVKQRSEKFEHELRDLKSLNKNAIESAAQKFKDDLMENVRKQLTEKKQL